MKLQCCVKLLRQLFWLHMFVVDSPDLQDVDE